MIIIVNMTTKEVSVETVPEKYLLLGGRALTSRMLLDNVDPNCEPLGPKNKIVIAPGLLGGTSAPCSGRLSIGTKSPLTGGIKESNGGGTAGTKLAKLGIKALVIEGQPEEENSYILRVMSDGVEILPGDGLESKGNYEVAEELRKRFGTGTSIISIGPAGERGYSLATVAVTDMDGHPTRHCGRGGIGAVLGSKKVKAIVIDDTNAQGVQYIDRESFQDIAKTWGKELKIHERI